MCGRPRSHWCATVIAGQLSFLLLGFFIAGSVPFTRTSSYFLLLFLSLLVYGTVAGIAEVILFRMVNRLTLAIAGGCGIFLFTVHTTSLITLLLYDYRSVQAFFLVICVCGSAFAGGLIYLISKAAEREIPLPSLLAGFAGPLLVAVIYWVDTDIFVGIYQGVHLFLRILAYLVTNLYILVLLATGRYRRRWFCVAAAVPVAALVLLSSLLKEEVSLPVSTRLERPDLLPSKDGRPRRVFIILVDALRVDHLSCYGYGRETTPNIDALAKEATIFRYCCAPGAKTDNSLPTLFSSRPYHRLIARRSSDSKNYLLGVPTIAQVLRQNGLYTLAMSGAPGELNGCGDGGFEENPGGGDFSMLQKVKDRLAKLDRSFVFLHYFELHGACDTKYVKKWWEQPHYAERGAAEIRFGKGRVNTYDSILKVVDGLIGELVEYLQSEDLYDDSSIIITADHGEGLGEHRYYGHCRSSYNGEILVPLIVKTPGSKNQIIYETVGLIDVVPTIMDLLDVEEPAGLEGRSLTPFLFEDDSPREPQRLYYYGALPTVLKGDYKLMEGDQLYRFKSDPLEKNNLFDKLPHVVDELTLEKEKARKPPGEEPFLISPAFVSTVGSEKAESEVPEGERPPGSLLNIALHKPYTVHPRPTGFIQTCRTDATDGMKPLSQESCFGYRSNGASLDVAVDIDLGIQERINAARLFTFFTECDLVDNRCDYGANYVVVLGSETGKFSGEEKLLGEAGKRDSASGEPGRCFFEIGFDPYECRYIRFLLHKEFGSSSTGTNWLFVKEAEVWKAAE